MREREEKKKEEPHPSISLVSIKNTSETHLETRKKLSPGDEDGCAARPNERPALPREDGDRTSKKTVCSGGKKERKKNELAED